MGAGGQWREERSSGGTPDTKIVQVTREREDAARKAASLSRGVSSSEWKEFPGPALQSTF